MEFSGNEKIYDQFLRKSHGDQIDREIADLLARFRSGERHFSDEQKKIIILQHLRDNPGKEVSVDCQRLRVGAVLGGSRIVRSAQGSVGQFFVAVNPRTLEVTGLKVLNPGKDLEARGAFLLEALQALLLPWHPNISGIMGILEDSSGSFIQQSPFTPGLPLNQHESTQTEIVVQWLAELASGLMELREDRPMSFHGDLHSGNIMIRPDGLAVMIDWGQSSILRARAKSYPVIPPELLGPGTAAFDPTSLEKIDVWGLGVTFFHRLTGQYPYTPVPGHETIATETYAHPVESHDARLLGLPDWLRKMLSGMVAPDQDQRWDLRRVLRVLQNNGFQPGSVNEMLANFDRQPFLGTYFDRLKSVVRILVHGQGEIHQYLQARRLDINLLDRVVRPAIKRFFQDPTHIWNERQTEALALTLFNGEIESAWSGFLIEWEKLRPLPWRILRLSKPSGPISDPYLRFANVLESCRDLGKQKGDLKSLVEQHSKTLRRTLEQQGHLPILEGHLFHMALQRPGVHTPEFRGIFLFGHALSRMESEMPDRNFLRAHLYFNLCQYQYFSNPHQLDRDAPMYMEAANHLASMAKKIEDRSQMVRGDLTAIRAHLVCAGDLNTRPDYDTLHEQLASARSIFQESIIPRLDLNIAELAIMIRVSLIELSLNTSDQETMRFMATFLEGFEQCMEPHLVGLGQIISDAIERGRFSTVTFILATIFDRTASRPGPDISAEAKAFVSIKHSLRDMTAANTFDSEKVEDLLAPIAALGGAFAIVGIYALILFLSDCLNSEIMQLIQRRRTSHDGKVFIEFIHSIQPHVRTILSRVPKMKSWWVDWTNALLQLLDRKLLLADALYDSARAQRSRLLEARGMAQDNIKFARSIGNVALALWSQLDLAICLGIGSESDFPSACALLNEAQPMADFLESDLTPYRNWLRAQEA